MGLKGLRERLISFEICLLWFEVAEDDECNYVSFYVMGAKQGRRESGPMVYFDLQKRKKKTLGAFPHQKYTYIRS